MKLFLSWKAVCLVLLVAVLAVGTHAVVRSPWLESRLDKEALHFTHVLWGMATAFVISGVLGWLALKRGIKPFAETPASAERPADETREFRRYALWFVQLRWLAALVAAILSFLATYVLRLLDRGLFLSLICLVLVLVLGNFAFLRACRTVTRPYRLIVVQTVFDLLLLTGLLQLSGGIENSLYVIYIFHVVIAAMLLKNHHSYVITTVASVLLAAVAFGEYFEVLPHRAINLTPHEQVLGGEEGGQHVVRHLEESRVDGEETLSRGESFREGEVVARGEEPSSPEEAAASTSAEHEGAVDHPAHDVTFMLGRLFPFLGILYWLTYLTQMIVVHLHRREKQLVKALQERKIVELQLVQAGKMAAIGELAGKFAHEVNNPVAIISGKAKLLLKNYRSNGLPEPVIDDLRKIELHAQRIAGITGGLLAFSRPSLGEKKPVDIERIIDSTLELVDDVLRKGGIRVVRNRHATLPAVKGNFNELQQVILNILTNAIDCMSVGGVLTVSTREGAAVTRDGKTRSMLVVSISDTGPGMEKTIRDRVFEPFFTTKKVGHGTGLGLSISQGLIRSHGGRIRLRSIPGQGTTFVVVLPAANGPHKNHDG